MLMCFVFLLSFLQPDFLNAIKVPCNETYQTGKGFHCFPCRPGFSKYSDCINNYEQDRCLRCPVGEYQPNCDDSTKCIKCRLHCRPGEIKVQKCSAISDIECQCKDGTFEVLDDGKPDETTCKAHSECKPGEGVEKRGTPYDDTICGQCKKGLTFSDEKSSNVCKPCSGCNTTAQPCTPTSDTVCDDQAAHKPTTKTPRTQRDVTVAVTVPIVVFTGAIIIAGILMYRKRSRSTRNASTVDDKELGRATNSPEHNEVIGQIADDTASDKLAVNLVQNGCRSESNKQNGLQHKQSQLQSREKNYEKSDKKNNCYEMSSLNKSSAGNNKDNDISTDAQPVPPRSSEWQSEDQSIPTRSAQTLSMIEAEDERVRLSTYNGTSMPSERSNGNERSRAVRGNPSSILETDNEEEDWMLISDFLSRNLALNDFKSFYRWLAVKTSKDLAETKDVDINRVITENYNDLKESMYQLVLKWRQATPDASMQQVLDALKAARLVQTHIKLLGVLEEKRFLLGKQGFLSDRPLGSDVQMMELKEH